MPDAMKMHARLVAVALSGAIAACASTTRAPEVAVSPAADAASAGLVDVSMRVPDIDLDIRYAGARNFTGGPVDGYDAPKCFLLGPAAEALAGVAAQARTQGLHLRVFDCYRPRRAVLHFMRWVDDHADQRTKAEYYPRLEKSALAGDYISPTSGHSRGATVDLTLLRCEAGGCAPLDMGTGFDLFDPSANTDSPMATPAQRANRHVLRDLMVAGGFRNYDMEWWHYTLEPEPSPRVAFDVPVR